MTAQLSTMRFGTEDFGDDKRVAAGALLRRDRHAMAVELRPWPGGDGDEVGYDAGPDLVIHDAPDGAPWLWEIEHASQYPEHIAAALAAMRQLLPQAAE